MELGFGAVAAGRGPDIGGAGVWGAGFVFRRVLLAFVL